MMPKRLPVILLLIIIAQQGLSQKADKGSLTLSLGPSIPLGDFGKKEFYNNKAGLAGIGQQATISYDHKLGKTFSLSVTFLAQRNPLNRKYVQEELGEAHIIGVIGMYTTTLQPPPQYAVPYSRDGNWKVDRSAWFVGSLLLGVSAEFPLKESGDLAFFTKAMIGVARASTPKLHATSSSDTAYVVQDQTSRSATGVSYTLKGGLKYNLSEKLIGLFSVDYFGTGRINFTRIKSTTTATRFTTGSSTPSQISQSQTIFNSNQAISAVNVSVGFGLRL